MTDPHRVPLPFPNAFPVVGMVHLLPLPGSPHWAGSMDEVVERAILDGHALEEGGVDGVLVENYGDTPYHPGPVPPETVAGMTRAAAELRRELRLPLGINVLRNDAHGALAIALAVDAAFIRVNVHTGTMFTDQGPITGRAHETLRIRQALGGGAPLSSPRVAILADVWVKHATPPPGSSLEETARDLWERGGADGLLVTGSATGGATAPEDVATVAAGLPGEAPIWVASGASPETLPALRRAGARGAIVGSAVQAGGVAGEKVERARVARFMEAARAP